MLAWVLNRYFYGDRHHTYLATPFHPYRQPNPPSSRPLELFQRLLEGAIDRDTYNDSIRSRRAGLHAGVSSNAPHMGARLVGLLHWVIDHVDPLFFVPVVYRVDLDRVDPTRLDTNAGTRYTVGKSQECLVSDLDGSEFDIFLFERATTALAGDSQLDLIASPIISPWRRGPSRAGVLSALLSRCI